MTDIGEDRKFELPKVDMVVLAKKKKSWFDIVVSEQNKERNQWIESLWQHSNLFRY